MASLKNLRIEESRACRVQICGKATRESVAALRNPAYSVHSVMAMCGELKAEKDGRR